MNPWENEDGSTNVDGFLTAYAESDSVFWTAASGHIQNVLDELIDRVANLRSVLRLACPTPDKQGVMAFYTWDHEVVRTAAWPSVTDKEET